MEYKTAKEQMASVAQEYEAMKPYLNERGRRIWAATAARLLGYGGQSIVHEATGLSGTTIRRGPLLTWVTYDLWQPYQLK
ncbi:MAG: hypothetical protein ABI947_12650 [Chloroflexota bacterium]